MTTLFSYCIPHDNGAAPNPFWGVCTLVICKPRIRREAEVGEWIVGTGSADSPIGDIRGKVVYAMRVTDKMPMRRYDAYVREHLPNKIPSWHSRDPRLTAGDSIYDFAYDPPNVRKSVHCQCDRDRDLRGQYALLSEHFYYFGDQPRQLPNHLQGLIKSGQGRRSRANDVYIEPFLARLDSLGLEPNRLFGKPRGNLFRKWAHDVEFRSKCGSSRTVRASESCRRAGRKSAGG